MIGIVVVAHSRALAEAAVDFALQMTTSNGRPRVAVAAGLDATTLGTDATAVAGAIEEVAGADGVLVLVDVGSAVLSTEMAVEFLDPELAERIRISPAPLVEGLVAAVVTAAGGAGLDAVDREARAGLLGKQEQMGSVGGPGEFGDPDSGPDTVGPTGDAFATSPTHAPHRLVVVAPVPHGLHARPAAAIVSALAGLDAQVTIAEATGQRRATGRSLSQLTLLGAGPGSQLTIEARGLDGARAVAALSALADNNFGDPRPTDAPKAPDPAAGQPAQVTVASTRECAVGPVLRPLADLDLSTYRPGDPALEGRRSTAARAAVADYLARLGDTQPILAAQAVLLADPEIAEAVATDVAAGMAAPHAWGHHLDAVAAGLEALPDGYHRDRAQDVRSIRRLLAAALLALATGEDPASAVAAAGGGDAALRQLLGPTEPGAASDQAGGQAPILVLTELDAATAATLDPARIGGVITTSGGGTGHGVLVARARGIPVLTGQVEAAALATGTRVAIDAVLGELIIDPDPTHLARLAERERGRRERDTQLARARQSAITHGGKRIRVEVNVSAREDAVRAGECGADGIGVLRTELLFATAATPPSASTQARLYAELADRVGGPVTIRTWDAGGDKPLPFLAQEAEANPFLGVRGIRLMRRAPEIFAEQLHAIARTALEREVRVLLPMVTDPDEVIWAAGLLDAARAEVPGCPRIPLGIMVEVPATALRLADYAGLVDFVSIGTNDLAQYLFAADRANGAVSGLARQDHPAILGLIAHACAALPDTPAAVCGALAADPALTVTLLAAGVAELSVPSRSVPAVKDAVRAY
ncbi:MAG: dihydroxyacetone kinase phosphoryl donor subunit DhaM [Tetrasphaera sp.]